MANFPIKIEVTSRASLKATIQPVLEGAKGAYIGLILQPRTEVTSREI
jgi:molybdopterin-binding protein